MEILVCFNWLYVLELSNLDIAMSIQCARQLQLNVLKVDGTQAVNKWRQPFLAEVDHHEIHSYFSDSRESQTLFTTLRHNFRGIRHDLVRLKHI
jgi:hypothetical protein